MPRGIRRLTFLTRRGAVADRAPSDAPAVDDDPAEFDDAPVGPPILLPAMIYRQVLIDSTEVTPVWAKPRLQEEHEPDGTPAATGAQVEPSAKQPTRRRKGTGSSGEPKAPAAPRRPRKPSGSRRRG